MSTTKLVLKGSNGWQRIVRARRAGQPGDTFEMANLYPRDTGLRWDDWLPTPAVPVVVTSATPQP